MKKVLFSLILVGVSALANAQKSEVTAAKTAWDLYANLGQKPYAKSMTDLNNGLKHTDLAVANEKSKVMPEAWSYRALFAAAIAYTDTVDANNSLAKQKIAEEAIKTGTPLDTKGTEKANFDRAKVYIQAAISGRGMAAYNKKDYAGANKYFSELLALNPADTAMLLNVAVTAQLSNNYPEAIKHYVKIGELNAKDSKQSYQQAIDMTLANVKDTTQALAIIKKASAQYPDDADFLNSEMAISFNKGEYVKSQETLKKLIAKDPNKAVYHFLYGNTLFQQAISMEKEIKKIDPKKKEEYNAMSAKMKALVDQAIPYYTKALEIDPKHAGSLENLGHIYAFKGETEKYNDIKKRIAALPPAAN